MVNLASFWKTEACGQTVLPDMSLIIGQKLAKNSKIHKFKCDILGNFQTMWSILLKFKDFFSGFAELFQSTDFDQWNYSPNITWTLIEAGLKLSGTQEYFPENFPLASRTLKIENNEFESCLESIQDLLLMPSDLLDWTLSSMPISWLGTRRCSLRYQKM